MAPRSTWKQPRNKSLVLDLLPFWTAIHFDFIMPRRMNVSHTCLEELIELVRQNPGQYDPALSSHKDAVMAENVWTSISKRLMIDNPSMMGRSVCTD